MAGMRSALTGMYCAFVFVEGFTSIASIGYEYFVKRINKGLFTPSESEKDQRTSKKD